MGRPSKLGWSDTPMYYLDKYKTTQRPRPCARSKHNAYYLHPDHGYLCASCLLDLVNIGGLAFSWEDYPEVWARTERLLQREPQSFGTVKNVDVDMSNAALWEEPLDGYYE